MNSPDKESSKIIQLAHFTIERAADAILWHGPDGRFQHVNEAACKQLGYTREQLLTMTVFDIAPDVDEDSFKEIWEEIRIKGQLQVEGRHRASDGRIFPVEVSVNYIELGDEELVCSFVRDICERKQREHALRLSDFTIERAVNAIFWVDSQSRICRVNETACRQLGYTREELLQKSVPDLNPDIDAEQWKTLWIRLKEEGMNVFESRHQRKDGSVFPVEISQNYLEFEGREYTCSFARDITEQKRSQEELTRMRLEKERIENELKYAALIQKEFLPKEPPHHPRFTFAAQMFPAGFVGGDFYDFIPIDQDQLGMVLGDVSGKGVSAALHMARLLSDFRYVCQFDHCPGQVMAQVNRILHQRSKRGMFATAVYLVLEMDTGRLLVANAGHHPILIRNRHNQVTVQAQAGGTPLGVLPETEYNPVEIMLQTGDLVFSFTDGAIEPKNTKRQEFGMARLTDFISRTPGEAYEIPLRLHDEIRRFTGDADPHDDTTFLTFKVL